MSVKITGTGELNAHWLSIARIGQEETDVSNLPVTVKLITLTATISILSSVLMKQTGSFVL